LNPQTVKRAWLGINTESRTEDRAAWGLEVKDDPKFVIPAGLVLPRFEGATLTRLLIWEDYAASPYQVRAVEGSQEQALVLGAGEGKAFLRVGNEIEAWLLSQELRGLCAVAAMTDAGTPLDDDSAGMLAQAPQFLVVKDPGRLDDPDGELAKWQALHPEAEFLAPPPGSSLAQAKNNGTNLRRWVLNALKPGLAPAEEDEEAEDPNQIVPKIVIPDIPAIVKKTQDDIKAAMKPKLDKAKAHVAEEGAKLDDMVRKAGYDPDALKAQADPLPKGNPFGAARVTEAFAQAREQLKKTQSLTPEIEKYLAENEKKLVEVQTQAAKLYDEGMPKIEAAKNLSPISDEAKAQFAAMGVDLDEPRTLTREDVIERYKDGRSMAGKNMSGVDLSGLELPGIDMKKAKLEKTNLSGTNLEGADLSRAIANEADFSQACLKSAVMNRAIMQKAKMSKADLKGADLTGALLSGSDLSGARMPGATLEKTLLEGANLTGADMSGTKAVRGYFLKTDLTGANFAGADVSRAIFSEAILPEADFSGATARKTLFHKVTGGKNRFGLADMFNVRVIEGSTFPDSDFSGATMDKSFWRDADLSRSDFSAVSMERAIMERCQMNGTDFSRAQGKRAGFNKSDMSWADLSGINMPGGSLRKTRLPKADLSGANLYSVEFMKTGMNETKLDGANLKLTKIYKREDLLP
ncbi:MAG: pentapeptide repeat-containing protein, partial [Proteobacteria bacterium]|nr:pentapeptide repeat-containing protein [Pseudomonadota bacterium]